MAGKLSRWTLVSCMLTACTPQTPTTPTTPKTDASTSDVDASASDDGTLTRRAPDGRGLVDGAHDGKPDARGPSIDASACPKALIDVPPAPLAPQSQVQLAGGKSVAADGSPATAFHWTAKQPPGSTSVFVPSATAPNPSFVMNVAGSYTFCLSVWDAQGVKSCHPACLTLLVLPDQALHIELTWDTPGGSDQSDSGPASGADLDLHFARAAATGPDIDCDGKPDPWFSALDDAFWFNPSPNWGPGGAPALHSPSLDLDDTDGAGPENLNLDDPEGTAASPATYTVGVHYWNDHGYGVSTPTVRVYVLGALVATVKGPPMQPLDFWTVGRLRWPNSASDPSSALSPMKLCLQHGQPCHKDAPGKMWGATGSHCVRPCYVNEAFTATQQTATPSSCVKP